MDINYLNLKLFELCICILMLSLTSQQIYILFLRLPFMSLALNP